jgi:hypothetical protein
MNILPESANNFIFASEKNKAMKTKILLLLSVIVLGIACNSSKDTAKKEDIYRVIVSFASKGEGPDTKTLASFESYLSTYAKKIKADSIPYDKYTYGREGEMDYCFYCKDMKKKEQKAFVAGLTNLAKEAPLVFVKENAVCMHKK